MLAYYENKLANTAWALWIFHLVYIMSSSDVRNQEFIVFAGELIFVTKRQYCKVGAEVKITKASNARGSEQYVWLLMPGEGGGLGIAGIDFYMKIFRHCSR